MSKKTTTEKIIEEIFSLGYTAGCIDDSLDNIIDNNSITQIINELSEEHTDIFISINNELYVVEISTVDNEKDIYLYTAVAYFKKYGNLEEAYDIDKITSIQYQKIKALIN